MLEKQPNLNESELKVSPATFINGVCAVIYSEEFKQFKLTDDFTVNRRLMSKDRKLLGGVAIVEQVEGSREIDLFTLMEGNGECPTVVAHYRMGSLNEPVERYTLDAASYPPMILALSGIDYQDRIMSDPSLISVMHRYDDGSIKLGIGMSHPNFSPNDPDANIVDIVEGDALPIALVSSIAALSDLIQPIPQVFPKVI